MATFVAPIESQIAASARLDRVRRRQQRRFALLLVSGLTLFALLIHGYHPYAEDGGLYAAGVKRLLHPALYPHSSAFVLEPMRFSLFAPLIATISRLTHLSLPAVLLLLYLASIWSTLFAAWLLAARCWIAITARCGAVVLLACWLTLPVAGTALYLMDPYLTARSFSTPCTLLALVGALDLTARNQDIIHRRRALVLCIASIALAVAMHPLMAAYALWATLILLSIRSQRRSIGAWTAAALCAAALVAAACLQYLAPPESPDYVRVALTRTYWFPARWAWYELAGLAAPLAILAAFAWRRSRQRDQLPATAPPVALPCMAVALGTTAALVAAWFARADSPTHLLASLQPLRAFQIVYSIMVILLGATLGQFLLRRSLGRWIVAVALLSGIMLIAERSAFPASSHIELSTAPQPNPWAQAFLWIRDNTPSDALFALDADYISAPGEDAQSFRAIAERSALPDYSKDGGEASISPRLAAAWSIAESAQQGLSAARETDTQRLAALGPLGVSWVVLEATAATRLNCPYSNPAVRVCRLR